MPVGGPVQFLREQYPQFSIGRGTYGNPRILSWGEGATLQIGSYCSISDSVTILLGGEHRTDWVTTYPFSRLWESARQFKGHPKTRGNVTIGHDVWIGYGAVILSGVTIESGAVIGCNAVVTKRVPAYGIVAGNPAHLVRKRFSDDLIKRLLAACWWDLDESQLSHYMPLLLSNKIEEFLRKFESRPHQDNST